MRRLDGARSLAQLVKRLARPGAEADRTGALDRARRLVDASERARRSARKRLKSIHIAANGRVIYARARRAHDLVPLTRELGDHFAQALAGSGLVVTIVTRAGPPPPHALRVAEFERSAEQAAAQMRAASAALAVGALATANAGLAAASPTGLPLASLTTATDWACGLSPPDRVWDVRLRVVRSDRRVELMGGDAAKAGDVLAFARSLDADALRSDPLAIVGPHGERIVGIVRFADPAGDGFDLTISSCAPPPPPAPEAPFERAYSEYGGDYIDRNVQQGAVVGGTVQFGLDHNNALNLQGAVGDIDHGGALGGQIAMQHYMPVGRRAEAAVGAFLSAVTSEAPNGDEFPINRAGVGVALLGDETQIVVRGGYAQSSGYYEAEGGFVRAEAGWFPVERLSLDVFAEHDPITGDGAGAGFTVRPFSGVYAGLMIDADGAWHEDGEESFRVGVRWAFDERASSEHDRRRRVGMVPYMPQEFERLPEGSNTQSYCGDAGGGAGEAECKAAPFN